MLIFVIILLTADILLHTAFIVALACCWEPARQWGKNIRAEVNRRKNEWYA